ncbi:MAG TPA: DotU family type IV/VI secretion system protein [Bryobacteraceae bacterium]|jgi:type VI secretion system protein ImpK
MGPQQPGGFTTAGASQRRQQNLAYVFQELITVGERLRSGRQPVNDSRSFRAQLLAALDASIDDARKRGYASEDVELAAFAVVAFLDESILNLRLPIFADWPKQPLQEQRYGHHMAGEIFFKNLSNLLARNETYDLADVLEVYYVCMLLGFAGKYSLGGKGELFAVQTQTGEKIQRIRKTTNELSPEWQLPNDGPPRVEGDPWVKTLIYTAIGCLVLTVILFVLFKVVLGSGVSEMANLAKGAH